MSGMVQGALVRAAERLEQGARMTDQALEIDVPRFFKHWRALTRKEGEYAAGLEQAHRGVAELAAAGPSAQQARDAIAQLLEWRGPPSKLRFQHNHVDREVRILPANLRQHARGLRLHAALEGSGDPAATRRALQTELDALVQRPVSELTREDALRLATISMLPSHLRPDIPRSINGHWSLADLGATQWPPDPLSRFLTAELDHVRLQGVARTMSQDPTLTREAFDAEVRSILALPDDQITAAHAERMSIIARLPSAKRPVLLDAPRPRGHLGLSQMSSWGYRPSTEGLARSAYDAMRRAVLQEELMADPTFTRERATAELMQLLAVPDRALTREQLLRVSTIAGLPEPLRPPMPPITSDGAVMGAADGSVLTPDYVRGARAFAAVRMYLTERHPEDMARMLAANDRQGGDIDLGLVAALARQPGLLERFGIDSTMLHRQSIRALAAAGGSRSDDLAANLRMARNVLAGSTDTNPAVAAVRAEALELADRNLDRMAGARTDTYGRHPDYAEIGRFASIATLLDQIGQLPAAKQAPAPTAAAEALTW
ncbi:MAG: hypothetical protein JWL76_2157 [Thermoleophilia bacterium]|nr:hypothetical protein [Thermoleophilia bacterium]